MPLTDTAVRGAKSTPKLQKLFDGNGLFLFVAPSGAKSWRLKYRILTVPFGKRGYSVAYFADKDEVVVRGIKHQPEEFFPFELEDAADEEQSDGVGRPSEQMRCIVQ